MDDNIIMERAQAAVAVVDVSVQPRSSSHNRPSEEEGSRNIDDSRGKSATLANVTSLAQSPPKELALITSLFVPSSTPTGTSTDLGFDVMNPFRAKWEVFKKG
ncbi:hypothetical protein GOBAR_AA18314 [Gossypium barbadense]|uniref:Uncharacterized protein n=1 Tax=Gossypium barbadense TaxID=3634 RepID=A0A2P5XG68_GOSBA|nr:hypothetical protein GOBAR_AA18314 [Gossypium barbadense]